MSLRRDIRALARARVALAARLREAPDCGGTFYNTQGKRAARCDRCGGLDYEANEGDRCTRRVEVNPRRWSRSSDVQSLLFDRESFTASTARAWARRHGFRYGDVDVTDGKVRLRQADPVEFSDFRTISLTDGVRAVVGPRRR